LPEGWLSLIGSVVTPLLTVLLWWLTASRRETVRRENLMVQDMKDRLDACQQELREVKRDNERLYRRIALRNADDGK